MKGDIKTKHEPKQGTILYSRLSFSWHTYKQKNRNTHTHTHHTIHFADYSSNRMFNVCGEHENEDHAYIVELENGTKNINAKPENTYGNCG